MKFVAALVALLVPSSLGFMPVSQNLDKRITNRMLEMQAKRPTKGANFNYDPSNYKDSNDGNYRRLGDQLAAAKAEDEQLKRERDELLRKEQMAQMFLKQEEKTFWDTPDKTIVGRSDQYFVPPSVLQVIGKMCILVVAAFQYMFSNLMPLNFINQMIWIINSSV